MSKYYTQTTAALKAVTIDAAKIDARNILIYSGSGDRNIRKNILQVIDEKDDLIKNDLSTLDGRVDSVESKITTIQSKKYAYTNTANTFSANNTFNVGFQALPLGTTTVTGQPAYGLSVTPPSEDGTSGGLQLWGVQFAQGDEWSGNALKIFHNELALFGNYQAPCSLTFDNANVVNFRVMPDDGSAANNGQGAIFDFQGWQWDNDTHDTKNSNCPVQILKNNAGELVDRSLLNRKEMDVRYGQLNAENHWSDNAVFLKDVTIDGTTSLSNDLNVNGDVLIHGDVQLTSGSTANGGWDLITTPAATAILNTRDNDYRYGQLNADNTFTKENTFEQSVQLSNGANSSNDIIVSNGNIVVNKSGSITFLDDGEITITENASGSLYVDCSTNTPAELDHNKVYDFGLIEGTKDLSSMQFTGGNVLIQTCEVWFKTGATAPTITWPTGTYWIDSATGTAPALQPNLKYRLSLRWEIDTIVASISYCYANN